MNANAPPNERNTPSPGLIPVGISLFALTIGLVLWQTRVALILWAFDGALAVTILLGATLAGYALLAAFRLGPLSMAWRWLASAGLGVGFLTTAVLVCGSAGWVGAAHRWVCPLLLGIVALIGLVLMVRSMDAPPTAESAGRLRWLVVAAAPFAAMAMVVATAPPGVLWQEEGFGYDVLEYHLELPKEYFAAGAITYLPHNVYANFPANAEMLYLFANILTGEGVESWSVSKCLNALLAGLFVAAAWMVGRERSQPTGIVAGVLAAGTGWVTYLCGVAYVENGMLLMAMLSCGCVLRAASLRAPGMTSGDACLGPRACARGSDWVGVADARLAARWCALAGVFAGLACGFKYTAVVLVALPLVVFLLIELRCRFARRLLLATLLALTTAIAFSPWLIKNVAMTGNPVFPLLGEVFTAYPEGWGAKEAAHFASAHAPAPEEAGVAARVAALVRHVLLEKPQRFGAALLVLAVAGVVRHRSRRELGLVAMLLVQVLVWLFATHLYARFAVPMLIPLLLLASAGAADRAGRVSAPFILLVLAGIGLSLFHTGKLYAQHYYTNDGSRTNVEGGSVLFTAGIVRSEQHLATINHDLPPDAKLLLVGEARAFYFLREVDYCVVFNRNPFVTVVEESPTLDAIIDWLGKRGYTHVFVRWDEIERLRRSRYGFPDAITPILFEQLEDVGLSRVEDFRMGEDMRSYGTLYAVP